MNSRKPFQFLCVLFVLISTFAVVAAKAPPKKPGKAAKAAAVKPAKKSRVDNKRANKNRIEERRSVRERKPALARRSELGRRKAELARRRAEAARAAAIARQRAQEDAMRARVQQMIAKDDTRGEDLEIRRIAVNALGRHAGTVVVMNPQTGRVYTIVNQEWGVHQGFKPCSTIKLVTSLAGLSEEVIDPANTAAISNSNRVSLTQALAYSKNDYFQQVGGQMGLSKMISYARQLGLGSKSGINVSGEAAGAVPSLRHSGAINRVFSHGDGFKVTPLQLATLASVFATRGSVVVPFLPRNPVSAKASLRRTVTVDSKVWQTITPGMVGAVNYGSGRKAFASAMTVAGKTGTCIENGQWVGLFTSFAPLSNPQYAIAVIARGSDGRNHFPALVAGRIYRALNDRMAPLPGSQMASTSRESEESANDGDEIDEEEAQEADDAEVLAPKANKNATDANQTIWGTERNAPATRTKRVILPVTKPRE